MGTKRVSPTIINIHQCSYTGYCIGRCTNIGHVCTRVRIVTSFASAASLQRALVCTYTATRCVVAVLRLRRHRFKQRNTTVFFVIKIIFFITIHYRFVRIPSLHAVP